MSRKKREEEAEILKKMYSDDGTQAESPSSSSAKPSAAHRSDSGIADDDEVIRCPKCGYVLSGRTSCPRCGYNGYVPMTKKQTRRVKLILYPIFLIIAVLVFLYINGYFGR